MDRTAGGIGGAAPASLDLYGQSSKENERVIVCRATRRFRSSLKTLSCIDCDLLDLSMAVAHSFAAKHPYLKPDNRFGIYGY